MTSFIGDYTCKVDPKGRISLPSAFKKQLTTASREAFVIKKDIFEKCLVMFPIEEWERQNKIIRSKLNPYNKEHAQFLRSFYRGTVEVELDNMNRFLIPKRLLDEVTIDKDVVLAGQDGKIEIWAKPTYDDQEQNQTEYTDLAQKIMGSGFDFLDS